MKAWLCPIVIKLIRIGSHYIDFTENIFLLGLISIFGIFSLILLTRWAPIIRLWIDYLLGSTKKEFNRSNFRTCRGDITLKTVKNDLKLTTAINEFFFTKSRIFDFLLFYIFGHYSGPNWHRETYNTLFCLSCYIFFTVFSAILHKVMVLAEYWKTSVYFFLVHTLTR